MRPIETRRQSHLFGVPTGLLAAVLCLILGCQGILPFRGMSRKDNRRPELGREGVAAFEEGKYDLAAEKFAQAMKSDENDLLSRRYYGEILWRDGKKNEAIHVLSDAAGRDGSPEERAAICESLAEKFLESDQAASALHYADKMIELTPRRHKGWQLRAMVCQEIGKKDEALTDYHRALQLAPGDKDLIRSLAVLEGELGDDRAALAVWEELGRLYPSRDQPLDVLLGKAEACRHLGRGLQAADCYAAAIERNPDDPALYRILAELHLENHNADAAREVAALAAERFPGSRDMSDLPARVDQIAAREGAAGVR
ncbi:MAG: tetratricopeptide repeat protein [Thermoguttaceae bacterium]|nr:tetratricopeptide repeat protein [Thermoguttaceae bacterium]